MKREHSLLFATFLFVAMLAGCCFEHSENHHEVPPYAYSMVPYDTGSTFRMRDTSGFINTFRYVSAGIEDEQMASCGNCCEDNYSQRFHLHMRGGSPSVDLEFGLLQEGWGAQSVHDPTVFSLRFDEVVEYRWTRYLSEGGGQCWDDPSTGVSCQFNLVVAGVTYDTLYQFTRSEWLGGISQEDNPVNMWYSTKVGLVKYTTGMGNTWELVP
ncbi:MAG: hypothetical protein U0176_08140 [Bacteroidia bacterium]